MSDKKKDEQVYNATENFDKVGSFENKSYNGGSGVGSKSNVEKLAQDYVNSNYDSFTKGDDYASLAKRYSGQGRQAMDDTIGQMAARTGGLASSYAASAGQQAYGGWMEKLEDAARSLYNDQMNEKMSKLGVAQGLYDRDYSEFVDNRNFNYGMYKDNVENAKWKDTMGYQQNRDNVADEQWNKTFEYQQNQDTKKAAEDFKNSIYDAAYWGNANWADFANKAKEYGINETEFNRIVKSAQGARGDDTYETEEDNLYAKIYYGESYENFEDYQEDGGTLDERSYNRIVKQVEEDKKNKESEKAEADELKAQEEKKRAQNEVMMMWAAGQDPSGDALIDWGWANENGKLTPLGEAYKHQATYVKPETPGAVSPTVLNYCDDYLTSREESEGVTENNIDQTIEDITLLTGSEAVAYVIMESRYPELMAAYYKRIMDANAGSGES